MHEGLYTTASEIIGSGKIGAVKMVRIHKNEPIEEDMKQAIKRILYEDITFILRHCGEVSELYAKTVDYKNSIIVLSHSNKCISHIALNFCGGDAPPVFRYEIVGTEGLIDYDSDKKNSVSGAIRSTDLDMPAYNGMEFDSEESERVFGGIFMSIEEKRPVRLSSGQGGDFL